MSYINKYIDFKTECISKLRTLLKEKGYNVKDKWEQDNEDKFSLPTQTYYGENGDYYTYTLVYWDNESFLGKEWESGDEYWFDIQELDLPNICHLIDFINGTV